MTLPIIPLAENIQHKTAALSKLNISVENGTFGGKLDFTFFTTTWFQFFYLPKMEKFTIFRQNLT